MLPPAEELQAADALREAVCNALVQRCDDIAPFIDGDFQEYVRRMRGARTWGGEPELAVAAGVVQRPISVFSLRASPGGDAHVELTSQYSPDLSSAEVGGALAAAEISVLFHGGGHYDLLVPGNADSARRRARL